MIENQKQLGISKNWVKKFQAALQNLEQQKNQFHPRSFQAQFDALVSQIEDLQKEIAEFELLQQSTQKLEYSTLENLPQQLIRARVAAGLTQAALAKKLGMKEQMIQRYEATKYANASLTRVLEVAKALQQLP